MGNARTYFAIDLKSFYASAECVAMGLDPLTTNLVVADVARTSKTICLAVSPSLKSYGISGRPRLFEVEQAVARINENRRFAAPKHRLIASSVNSTELAANPQLELTYIAAKPRMAYYVQTSAKIYEIYLHYAAAEDIHVYSIDEVFIDVTRYLKYFQCTAHELARRIVADIYRHTGITATAGIGSNMYLAKIAMDIVAKHIQADRDGVRIAQLDEMSYRKQLWSHRPLTDFWRVGPGIARKLQHHGLYTMGDIARCSLGNAHDYYNEDLLYSLFGVNAELLIDHAWGFEPCTIADIQSYKPQQSSVGSGQVLAQPYSFERARTVLAEMAEQLALDLVQRNTATDQIAIAVGFDAASLQQPNNGSYEGATSIDRYGRRRPKSVHASLNLGKYTASSVAIRQAAMSLFYKIVDPTLLVRRLNITACRIRQPQSPDATNCVYEQPDLLEAFEDEGQQRISDAQDQRQEEVQRTILQVRQRFGNNAVVKGLNLEEGATGIQRNNQIGGHAA